VNESQGERKHSLHCSKFNVGFACLHSLHMRRFSRMSLQVLQICSASAVLFRWPSARNAAVFLICISTSCSCSIIKTRPLT